MIKPIILCVDDEKSLLDTLITQLTQHLGEEFDFETAEGGEEGLELFTDVCGNGNLVAVVISDQLMPGMKGDEMLIQMHKQNPDTQKILLTGQASADAIGRAVNQARLYRYIAKPWEKMDLILTVDEAAKSFLRNIQIRQQNQILASLYNAAKVMNEETTLLGLAEKLSEIIIKNTETEGGAFMIVESGVLDHAPITGLKFQKKENAITFEPLGRFAYPATVVAYVQQTRQPLVLPNALIKPYGTDPYIEEKRPKALICLPLEHDNQLVGILYLENFSAYSAFTNSSVEFLSLLAANTAVSVEKATLYQQLEQKVEDRTKEVREQKKIIELKNKDITDSIIYARRIQNAILQNPASFTRYFHDSFILYLPKDIISGDFYWFTQQEDYIIFAAADCTGHGVPGAMLSVLGTNLLHSIVREREVVEPGRILQMLHAEISSRLRAKIDDMPGHEHNSYDGMDIGLCSYHVPTQKLWFAGAQRGLYLLRSDELLEFKGDRHPIGGNPELSGQVKFQALELQIQPKDLIFIFTDGITDQFGGENHRKFTPKRLQDFLLQNQNLDMHSLALRLQQVYDDWKGQIEQTDDILIFGVRF